MNSIHPWRWKFLLAWVIIFTAATGWSLRIAQGNSRDGQRAHAAICSLIDNDKQRILSSVEFLAKHPKGIQGIASRSEILLSIKNQSITIAVLNKEVSC